MAYNYNPLLRLDLQKKQNAATPSDIDRLQGEIDQINEDLSKKVPKIFTSITELQDGEIGQYQGTTNEIFTYGFFYTKGAGGMVVQYQPVSEKTFVYAIGNTTSEVDNAYYQTSDNVDLISTPIFQITSTNTVCIFLFRAGEIYINVFMMPFEVNAINGISVNEDYDIFSSYDSGTQTYYYNKGNLAPLAYGTNRNVYEIKFENGNIFALIDGDWIQASRSGISAYAPPRFGWAFYRTNYSYGKCVDVFIVSTGYRDVVFPYKENNIIDLQSIEFVYDAVYQNLRTQWQAISDTTKQLYSYSRVFSPSVQRVDTQPSLNPADFATAAQGAKADTALQAITHGTDGIYVTSTIGTKDANNEQSVSVSLTLQPIATAGSGAKGVAEASDVKDYIGNNTATPSQGSKADSALQQIVHGTDGSYITTTVTQKDANNEQTIYTALTLQDIETADEAHKGVAEAANVRNFFNVIAAESEAYGVMWDTANPSPNLTRIGNMRNHALLPIQSAMIGGVLADDGTFTPFDNQADWTQATQARDGSDGQVMVQLPRHWRRCEKSGTYNIVMISPVAIPGYVEVRQQYVSAYEATLQHSTSKLCSVNNADADYRGGQNEASWDGTYRTLLNRPITNYNLAEFRTFARNRANNTKWNCLTYEAVRTIYWLFVTEYATLNSQADFNSALDANGFRQGGLGIGVSNWDGDTWNAYNGYAPLIPCGILDEYGSGTAIKNFSVYNADTTLAHTFSCNKYRGIEMPFAHIWKYVDGVLVNVESGDGISTVYSTTDTSYFSSTSFANYAEICNSYRVDSFIKDIVFNKEGDIFAISPNGNSTSYYCDQYWGGNLPSATELRAWRFGGFANNGARCGLACSLSIYGVGHRYRNIGSRLCFVP